MLARKLSGRFVAERIEFADGVFTATGILTQSTPAEIERSGLEIRRIDVTAATTRVVVAYAGHHRKPSAHAAIVGGESLSAMIRSIAESNRLEITALRYVDDHELVVSFVGPPDGVPTLLFATDRVARIVRIAIEPTGESVRMMYVVTPRGSYVR